MKRYLVQLLILSVVMVVVAACGQATTPAYPAATQAVANAPVPTAKATPTKSAAVQPTATTVAASPSATAGAQSDKVWTLSQLKDKKQLPQSSDWPNCKPGGYFGIGPECIVEPKTGPQLTGGCPPQGVGDESEQNQLKNRDDNASQYYPVSFDQVAELAYPQPVPKNRKNWPSLLAAEREKITDYETIPISIIGYLNGAEAQGAETTNCNAVAPQMVDWHIWLTKIQGAKEKYQGQAIVIEATPRVRARRGWTDETLKQLKDIVNQQTKVRISGWLFFDPEHPGNVYPTPSAPSQPEVLPTDISGRTRKTLWEIHPIMQIEVWQDGWITLDKLPKPTPKP